MPLLLLVLIGMTAPLSSAQYCTPTDSCWPTAAEWGALNEALGGQLRQIDSVDTVHEECVEAINALAGLAASRAANGSCSFAGACVYERCETGLGASPNIPVFSVAATTEQQVMTAVAFASEHNIRVSVKSTGASYSVSSLQPESLLIWMSNFTKFSQEGVQTSFVDTCGATQEAVLRVGGGEVWGDVFAVLAADGRYVLSSGAAVPVGAAGGWLQGGGLGPLDRELGLGIDNVLSFEVILADGSLVTADGCSEPDLFWALRGGGGGNWGVVVSATYLLHPAKAMSRAYLGWLGAPAVGLLTLGARVGENVSLPHFWAGADDVPEGTMNTAAKTSVYGDSSHPSITKWHDVMLGLLNPATMDSRLDGYYSPGCAWVTFACADLYFRGTMAEFEEAILTPLRAELGMERLPYNTGLSDEFFYNAGEYGSFYAYAAKDCKAPAEGSAESYICDEMGFGTCVGWNVDSQEGAGAYGTGGGTVWLVPSRLLVDDKPKAKRLLAEPMMFSTVGHILGGRVSEVGAADTAISPAARGAAMHLNIPKGVDPFSPTMEHVRALIEEYFPPPESAPCFNHDPLNLDVLEPLGATHGLDWQQLYWGTNLERLRAIKATYDPQAIFTCRDCVTASATACPPGCKPTGEHSWRRRRLAAAAVACPIGCEPEPSLADLYISQFVDSSPLALWLAKAAESVRGFFTAVIYRGRR